MPRWLLQPERHELLVFALILARTSGLMLLGAPFGTVEVPMRIRAMLAVALALLATPLHLDGSATVPTELGDMLLTVGGELMIGLTLGVGLLLLYSGMQLAGSLISTISGVSAADLFNPGTDTSIPLFGQFFYLVALAVYLAIGGHRWLAEGLLDTFAAIPPGQGGVSAGVVDTLITLATQSMGLGLRAAAPAMVSLLLATLVLGLMSRTLPQLNLLMFGFGVNAAVTFGVLLVSLGGVAWLFQDHVEMFLQTLLEETPARRGAESLF